MKSQLIFQDENEIKRLGVQSSLLYSYEEPIFSELLSNKSNLNVLDIGTNDGMKTAKKFSSDKISKIIGVEYNPDLVKKANQNFGNEKFSFYAMDVEAPDFADRIRSIMKEKDILGFDIIYLSFILMHLQDIKKLLKAIKELMSEDGKLFIIDADDSKSTLSEDPNNLLKEFLSILDKDKYSGNRKLGKEMTNILSECGYVGIHEWYDSISASSGEIEKKGTIFTSFFSYLPDDIEILLSRDPDNLEYNEWKRWIEENFEDLKALILKDETSISIGMKFITCTKATHDSFTLPDGQAFTFHRLIEEEATEAKKLCDECGSNNLSLEELLSSIDADDRFFYLLKNNAGKIIGYTYFYLSDLEVLSKLSKLDITLFEDVYPKKRKVGTIQSIGLKEEFHGKELAACIIRFIEKKLKEISIDAVFIVCCKPDGVVSLKKCSLNFLHEIQTVCHDYENLTSPYCDGKYQCSAEVYYKLFER